MLVTHCSYWFNTGPVQFSPAPLVMAPRLLLAAVSDNHGGSALTGGGDGGVGRVGSGWCGSFRIYRARAGGRLGRGRQPVTGLTSYLL
jgi:hypothetical protein